MTREFSVIGKPTPMLDAFEKVTGRAVYTGDIVVPGLLYGRILRSPFPHANILNIDTARAEALPGVKAVVTAKDGPGRLYGMMSRYADEHIPCLRKTRYVGDAVAAVAATDLDTAEEALDMISVDYEPLPAVFDPVEAMGPDAPQIHAHVKNNISLESGWHFGDVDAAFRDCYLVREDHFDTQPATHSPMEPHTVLAEWSGDRLTLHASTQSATVLHHNISWTLDIPESKVRVIPAKVGGGFGGKVEMFAHDVCAALLARKAGRPVVISLTRDEELCAVREKHPMAYSIKTGVRKDGTLVAREVDLVADGGAYISIGPMTMYLFGAFMLLPYRIPNYRYHFRRVYTNKTPRTALRGHGAPQANFGAEVQMDMIAEDLHMDPLELRRKNAVVAPYTAPNGLVVQSAGLLECIDTLEAQSGWREKQGRRDGRRGLGIACNSFVSGNNFSPNLVPTVVIKVQYDAGVSLFTGAADMGQGSYTTLAAVAAEELGLTAEDINVTGGDTALTPPDSGAYSSRTTIAVGRAAQLAAAEVKRQVFDVVAQRLKCAPQDLQARDRRIYVKGTPERGMTWREAIRACFSARILPIVVTGTNPLRTDVPDWYSGIGNVSPAYTFAGQVVEVDVDLATGDVKLERVWAAHDCGRAINPLSLEGQVEGSVVMGLSMTKLEELPRSNGAVLHSSLLTYRVPTAVDMPPISTYIVETNDPAGPFGAKEAGESLQIPTAASTVNAIHDALGIWITSLPVTPEKVLAQLEARQKKNG